MLGRKFFGALEPPANLVRTNQIGLVLQPDLRPGLRERQFPGRTLRMFIQNARGDARLGQQTQQQVRFRKIGGSAEADHANRLACSRIRA